MPWAHFLDVGGAFNVTSYQSICGEAVRHGVPSMLVGWVRGILCESSEDRTCGVY